MNVVFVTEERFQLSEAIGMLAVFAVKLTRKIL